MVPNMRKSFYINIFFFLSILFGFQTKHHYCTKNQITRESNKRMMILLTNKLNNFDASMDNFFWRETVGKSQLSLAYMIIKDNNKHMKVPFKSSLFN